MLKQKITATKISRISLQQNLQSEVRLDSVLIHFILFPETVPDNNQHHSLKELVLEPCVVSRTGSTSSEIWKLFNFSKNSVSLIIKLLLIIK